MQLICRLSSGLKKLNKYAFKTPNDGGTGAQYRGLITF